MPLDRPSGSRDASGIALILILAAAAAARLWFLTAGLPHAVGIDEPQVIDRAIRILRTGDWNTHLFDYPSLVIYFHAIVAIGRFMAGALNGEWSSLDDFSIRAIYIAGRAAAACVGVATVWVTYRLGREAGTARVGLLAAAQLAVHPMHVRESRFILTDVPVTALTTLAVWLSIRAARVGTIGAYAWAGAACGFAAAAKYNGGLALAAVVAAWALAERSHPDRLAKLGAIAGAAAAAFLAGAPYTLLDLPGFLDGFAAQFSRFAAPASGYDPAWVVYLKHLSPPWARAAVPLTVFGAAVMIWRSGRRWIPIVAFTAVYFYVLSSHGPVFGRYALPLVPMLCVFAAAGALETVALLDRFGVLRRPRVRPAATFAVCALLVVPPVVQTVRWLDQQKRADTRSMAADWLKANTPKGTRVAVENSGPTYLASAGFRVAATQLLLDRPLDWYRTRVDYLVISSADLSRYDAYTAAGPTVFQVSPTPQRWGPPIAIVRIGK